MNEITTIIIKAVLAIISVVITTVLIPYLKEQLGDKKFDELTTFIEYAVRCAEQMYTPDQWKEKKEYVSMRVTKKAREMGIEISESDIDLIIEGMVNLVKHDKRE